MMCEIQILSSVLKSISLKKKKQQQRSTLDSRVSRAIDMTASTLTASLSQSPIRTVPPRQEDGPVVPALSRRERGNFTDAPRLQIRLASPTSNPFYSVRLKRHRTSQTQTDRHRVLSHAGTGACDLRLTLEAFSLGSAGPRSPLRGAAHGAGPAGRGGAGPGGLCPGGVGGPRPPPLARRAVTQATSQYACVSAVNTRAGVCV